MSPNTLSPGPLIPPSPKAIRRSALRLAIASRVHNAPDNMGTQMLQQDLGQHGLFPGNDSDRSLRP